MTITFYYGSGSPFSWKVLLALEHKQIPYELKWLSLQRGDLKQAEYLAINPRGRVPAITDDGFALWESSVIVEYLEERYPSRPLLPLLPRDRAIARRFAAEVEGYLYPVQRRLLEETLLLPEGRHGDPVAIVAGITSLQRELDYFENALEGDYLVESLSVADFALYPLLALVRRLHDKQPQHRGLSIGPKLTGFMQRIEQLPYFVKTIPPHWKG